MKENNLSILKMLARSAVWGAVGGIIGIVIGTGLVLLVFALNGQ